MNGEALEHEIRQRVDEPEPWQVYADWLSSHGDARGRRISLELRLAHPQLDADARTAMEAELERCRGDSPWSKLLANSWRAEHRHGFLLAITAPAKDFEVERFARLLAEPSACLLASLRLEGNAEFEDDEDFDYEDPPPPPAIESERLAALLALDLSRLRSLAIAYKPLGAAGVELLVRCSSLARLRELDLRHDHLGDELVEQLARASFMPGLRRLLLHRNRLGARGAAALASVPFTALDRLDLRENPLGVDGAKALAAAPGLAGLDALYLLRDDIGAEGARALADSPHLRLELRRHFAAIAATFRTGDHAHENPY